MRIVRLMRTLPPAAAAIVSEALGAPGSPQRTWDKDVWFPMLSHKGATALNSAGRPPLRGSMIPQQ